MPTTPVTWYIETARKNHGKTMFVRKDLMGYTSVFEKCALFKTKREAEQQIGLFDFTYGEEIVKKFVG